MLMRHLVIAAMTAVFSLSAQDAPIFESSESELVANDEVSSSLSDDAMTRNDECSSRSDRSRRAKCAPEKCETKCQKKESCCKPSKGKKGAARKVVEGE